MDPVSRKGDLGGVEVEVCPVAVEFDTRSRFQVHPMRIQYTYSTNSPLRVAVVKVRAVPSAGSISSRQAFFSLPVEILQ